MIILHKRSENWLLFNLTKVYLLGVSDPNFMKPTLKLLEENADECAWASDRYIMLYIWLNLGQNPIHRRALQKRIDKMFQPSSKVTQS
jgi:hypothetical protein